MLGPSNVHRSRLIGAVDFNIPTRRGESAVLGGVGDELMQQQRKAGNNTRRKGHVTSGDGETAGRFLLVVRGGDRPDQRMQRRGPRPVRHVRVAVRQGQRVRPGQRCETGARGFNNFVGCLRGTAA